MLILAIALALSLDGLVAGAALGLRGVRIGGGARAAVALLSAGFAALSISVGTALAQVSPRLGTFLGAGILMLLGLASIIKATRAKQGASKKMTSPNVSAGVDKRSPNTKKGNKVMSPKRFHLLGLTILVIREPSEGDLDHSGRIELIEALLLGLSLSIDMLGAGVGLGLTGINPVWLPLAVGAAQTICLSAGGELGRRLHRLPLGQRAFGTLAGALLLALGIMRLAF